MTDPADVDTIENMLKDYGVDDLLNPVEFQDLLARLQDRENIMITDQAPRFIYKSGLDNIINQY